MAAQNEYLRTIESSAVRLVYDTADPKTVVFVYKDFCKAREHRDPEAPCLNSRTRDCGRCKLAEADSETIQNRMAALEMKATTDENELGDRVVVADAGVSDSGKRHKIEVKWTAGLLGMVSVISYNQ